MLKTILNLSGAQLLNKNEQKMISGGNFPFIQGDGPVCNSSGIGDVCPAGHECDNAGGPNIGTCIDTTPGGGGPVHCVGQGPLCQG